MRHEIFFLDEDGTHFGRTVTQLVPWWRHRGHAGHAMRSPRLAGSTGARDMEQNPAPSLSSLVLVQTTWSRSRTARALYRASVGLSANNDKRRGRLPARRTHSEEPGVLYPGRASWRSRWCSPGTEYPIGPGAVVGRARPRLHRGAKKNRDRRSPGMSTTYRRARVPASWRIWPSGKARCASVRRRGHALGKST